MRSEGRGGGRRGGRESGGSGEKGPGTESEEFASSRTIADFPVSPPCARRPAKSPSLDQILSRIYSERSCDHHVSVT